MAERTRRFDLLLPRGIWYWHYRTGLYNVDLSIKTYINLLDNNTMYRTDFYYVHLSIQTSINLLNIYQRFVLFWIIFLLSLVWVLGIF